VELVQLQVQIQYSIPLLPTVAVLVVFVLVLPALAARVVVALKMLLELLERLAKGLLVELVERTTTVAAAVVLVKPVTPTERTKAETEAQVALQVLQ
jgi:hypothetical protein